MFNFNFDKRYIYIIIGFLVLLSISNLATQEGAILGLILSIPGLLLAITFHEFAHAFVADRLGDDTPRLQGRLSLNPLDHLDPLGVAMLLFAHIGWGKPVQVNPRNYDRRFSMEKADALVSLAGPATNFILAIVLTLIYCAIYKFVGFTFMMSTVGTIIMSMISYAILLNIGLGVFNLIPLPPLDGSKVLMHFLPYNAKVWFESKEHIFYIAFLILFITGIAGDIISPLINTIYSAIMNLVGVLF